MLNYEHRHCIYLVTKKPDHAAFQLYSVGFAGLTCKIPESLSFKDACVLPLAISTAASGLYMKDFLKLPYPITNSPQPLGKSLLVFGASSSVGALAVQLAVASGVEVVATASAANHELVKSLGATEVFDHKDPDAVKKIINALKSAGECVGVYDAIGLASATKLCAEVLQEFGGGFIASTLDLEDGVKLPDNVKTAMCKIIAGYKQASGR
jgi:NADPH:quinone reductase-like Zn-dependent oxidoreductase